MKKKRDARLSSVLLKVAREVGKLNQRELFLAGLFLYWGEGGKTQKYSITFTNTNPAMLKFFVRWAESLGVSRKKLKAKLHLYVDMDESESVNFWSSELRVRKSQFRKSYVKKSRLSDITYKNGFGRGTCSLTYDNRDVSEYVLSGVKYLESLC